MTTSRTHVQCTIYMYMYMDSAITRHIRSNHDCLIAVCSHVFDLFSAVAQARNHFHLDVLEAVYIKLHSPVLCTSNFIVLFCVHQTS